MIPAHLEASAWAGKGADVLGLSGPVEPDTFHAILEGKVPDGPHLGKRGKDGEIEHRPGRDVTMSRAQIGVRSWRWSAETNASSKRMTGR